MYPCSAESDRCLHRSINHALWLILVIVFSLGCRGSQRDKPEWTLRVTQNHPQGGEIQQGDQGGGIEAFDLGISDQGGMEMEDMNRPPLTRVELATEELLPMPETSGRVRLFQAQRAEDLIQGPTQLGRVGDYIFENDRARFVIEADDRVIGPCPYGGNTIDAERLDQPNSTDQLGELCLLVNLAQTLKPDRFEILEDGSTGRALLAITGHLELLDFINIMGFARSYLPPTLRLGFDTERLLPLTLTVYYAMVPSQPGLRVVTMLRNDGQDTEHFPVGHLIDSGGEVTTFNPYSPTGGFGAPSFSTDNLAVGPALMALAFVGREGGHLYMPDPFDDLQSNRPFPVAGTYLTISGVSVSLLGTQRLLSSLLISPSSLPSAEGFVHLDPGSSHAISHWHWVGGASLASMMDEAWQVTAQKAGFELRSLSGLVESRGTGLSNVAVSLIDARGQTLNQALSDAEGHFHLKAPLGSYELAFWRDGYGRVRVPLDVDSGEATDVIELTSMSLSPAARLRVEVQEGMTAQPSPARVTILCDPSPCEDLPNEQEADLEQDRLHSSARAVVFAGMDGIAEFELPPGNYRVVVSRGPHWSVWPNLSGEPISLTEIEQETQVLSATIDEAITRRGWRSADFHVHGINSPDAPVSLERRVLSFLAEGVDIMVSTDHDYITDYGPTIRALGADQVLKHIIGEELTTFDYGHYNGFPLEHRPELRNGGAWDWAGAEGLGASPAQIFEWMHSNPGEQVVMVNHARGGYFSAMKIDVLRGTSAADSTLSRIRPIENLWDEGFTAMEVYNGYDLDAFYGLYRAWLTLLGRGYKVTATAVSDTHKTLSTTAGGPRSWVYVGEEIENTWDEARFIRAVNRGQVIGSNGPLLLVQARALESGVPVGSWAEIGDTLDVSIGDAVEVRVRVHCPQWMELTQAHVLTSLTEGLDVGPGEFDESPLTPTASATLTLLDMGVEGGPTRTLERVYEAYFTLDAPSQGDGYVVAWVEGDQSLFPVLNRSNIKPFAFSNAILLDGDGGGYQTPPLAQLLRELQEASSPQPKSALMPLDPHAPLDLSPLIKELEHGH